MFEHILTNAQLAALGRVVAQCAHIEFFLDTFLQTITRLSPEQYAAFMQGNMLGRKIEILREIGMPKLPIGKRTEFKQILDTISHLNADRVVFVHGKWKAGKPGNEAKNMLALLAMNLPPSGDGFAVINKRGKEVTLTAARLEATATNLGKAYMDLRKFWRVNLIGPSVRRRLREEAVKKSGEQS